LSILHRRHFDAYGIQISKGLLGIFAPRALDGFEASVVGKPRQARLDVALQFRELEHARRQLGLAARRPPTRQGAKRNDAPLHGADSIAPEIRWRRAPASAASRRYLRSSS